MSENSLKKWVEKIAIETNSNMLKKRASEVASTIRKTGEAGVVGAALGTIDAEIGLDQKNIPLDLVGAVAADAAALYFSDSEYSDDMSNVGANCMAIFSFRKTRDLVKRMGMSSVHGEDDESNIGEDEDPVVRAAREL